jgi:iron complex outermembrane receptor protein
LGGFNDTAGRLQLLWTPTDNFSALLLYQQRELDGNSASAFRANIIAPGTNDLNSNFVRDTVWYDGGGGNPAEISAYGTNLTLDWDVGGVTLTSITSYQDADQTARGDIDGGIVDPTLTIPTPPGIQCVDAGFVIPIFGPARTCPDFIFISSDTGGHNFIKQLTQEFRIASNTDGAFSYQVGAFFFEDELSTSTEFGVGPAPGDTVVGSIAFHENTTWAVFAQGSYDISDQTNLTVGVRYTDDEKDYTPTQAPPTQLPVNLTDTNVSWDVSLSYALTDASQVYGRIATGFRAPSIQARNAAFGGPVTTATSETIISYEIGYKADLSDQFRLNAAVFYYDVDDMQLTAIGGGGNFTTLLNADSGTGAGFEIDVDWLATDNLMLSGGFGYNDTSINDSILAVTPGAAVTVLDPIDGNGNALIDGNPFQHAPDWTLNLELAYDYPLSSGNSLFFFTDWKFKGDTNEFLYESVEFQYDMQFEGGLRAGYRNNTHNYEVALFGRNITDEENPIGGIDFSNLTSYVNEPQIWGIEASISFD